MARRLQTPMIRAVAQAAYEQNLLTSFAYDGVVRWIEGIERQTVPSSEDQAIRKASEVMIRRLQQPVSVL